MNKKHEKILGIAILLGGTLFLLSVLYSSLIALPNVLLGSKNGPSLFSVWEMPLLWVVLGVILFFIFRATLLWYWKVDRIVELLEKIEQNSRK